MALFQLSYPPPALASHPTTGFMDCNNVVVVVDVDVAAPGHATAVMPSAAATAFSIFVDMTFEMPGSCMVTP